MNTQLADQLKAANTTVIVTPESLIMEKVGDTFRGVYLGLRAFDKLNPQTGEIERKPVAHFYDGEHVLFNMGAMLTNAIEVLPPGISVEIVLKELKANNKGGKTKIYSVAPLDLPKLDLSDLFGGLLELTAPDPKHLIPPSEVAGEIEAPRDGRSNFHPSTLAKWDALIQKAIAAGVDMNFELTPGDNAQTMTERVGFIKAEIAQREQEAPAITEDGVKF